MINDVAAALGDAAKPFEVRLLNEHSSENRKVLFFDQQFRNGSTSQFFDLLRCQCFIHRVSPQALIQHRRRYLS